MAKKSTGPHFGMGYILLAILALNCLALITTIGIQWYTGRVTSQDLISMMRVLGGSAQYVLDKQDLADLKAFREEQQKEDDARALVEGSPTSQAMASRARIELLAKQEEQAQAMAALIRKEQEKLQSLKSEYQTLKDDVQNERDTLNRMKLQRTKDETSKNMEDLTKTLASMDPEALARYLESQEPQEAARLLRSYIRPNRIAGIFEGMTDASVRNILPLLENEYADLEPEKIVKLWTQPGTKHTRTPQEVAQYLRNFNVKKAFAVYSLLNPTTRAQVVHYLQRLP